MVPLNFRDTRKCFVRVPFLFKGPPFPPVSPDLTNLDLSTALTAVGMERAMVCQGRAMFRGYAACSKS